jgi:hypothetical protein
MPGSTGKLATPPVLTADQTGRNPICRPLRHVSAAVPVLAGSAGYAIGEARKWPTGLARQPLQAKAFYATLANRHDGGGCIEFYVIQSDPGTILVRGHQRCSGGAGDGPDDASYRQYKGHGPIYRDWRPAFYGVADDRRHGGCGSRNAHYCSHVARVAP